MNESIYEVNERVVRDGTALVKTVLSESVAPSLTRAELASLTGIGVAQLRLVLERMMVDGSVITSRGGPRSYTYTLASRVQKVEAPTEMPRWHRPPLKGYTEMLLKQRELREMAGGRA